ELAYRGRGGEQLSADQYHARFPDHIDLVDALFQTVPSQASPMAVGDDCFTTPAVPHPPPDIPTQLPGDDVVGVAREIWPHIPGYQIVNELGRGAMGIVYKAWQQRAKRHVALKLIRDGFLAGPEHRRRFKIEAEAAAQFQHPNLIRIYQVGEHQGLMYFSMELGEGGSLDKVLAGKPLLAREAAALAQTLAEA